MLIRVAVHRGLLHEGNHHATFHLAEVALVHVDVVHLAVHAARKSVNLDVQESFGVDPYVLHVTILLGDLQPVRRLSVHQFGAVQVDPGSFGHRPDQRAVQIIARSLRLGFFLRERFGVRSVQERPQLPPLLPVIHLHSRLAGDQDFQPHLVRALQVEREGQLQLRLRLGVLRAVRGRNLGIGAAAGCLLAGFHDLHGACVIVGRASIDLTGELQSLDCFPGLCAAAGGNVFLEDLCSSEAGHLCLRCRRCGVGRVRRDDRACYQQQESGTDGQHREERSN